MYKKLKFIKYMKNIQSTRSGMTLVELMVVLGIFLMVAGLTIFDYGRFRSSVSVQNLADDIALTIRRAQNYAIGVQNTGSDFSKGYGIHFSTVSGGTTTAGSNKSFIIFNDANPNMSYDSSGSGSSCDSSTVSPTDECLDLLSITTSDQIVEICPDGSCGSTEVDIVFVRPEPNAHICVGGSCSASSVDIVVKDLRSENTKTITITSVGQISVR